MGQNPNRPHIDAKARPGPPRSARIGHLDRFSYVPKRIAKFHNIGSAKRSNNIPRPSTCRAHMWFLFGKRANLSKLPVYDYGDEALVCLTRPPMSVRRKYQTTVTASGDRRDGKTARADRTMFSRASSYDSDEAAEPSQRRSSHTISWQAFRGKVPAKS
jgi:hypothetical protein